MTDGDRRFLARLVASHKAVISEECARSTRASISDVRHEWTEKLRKSSVPICALANSSQTFCAVYLHRNHVEPFNFEKYEYLYKEKLPQ